MNERLWAKSWNDFDGPAPEYVFLPQHLADVHDAAVAVLDATETDQLTAFGLDPIGWGGRLRTAVRLAAVCHDLGKANDHFQGMILKRSGRIGKRQGLRHEWVSYWIMEFTELRDWLRSALPDAETRDFDWQAVLWAITGHHPAAGRSSPPPIPARGEGDTMTICRDGLLTSCLEVVQERLNLPVPKIDAGRFPKELNLLDVTKTIGRRSRSEQAEWNSGDTESDNPRGACFVAAVKNCLVASDIAGSALPPEDHSKSGRRSAVINGFSNRPTPDELRQVVRDRLTNKETGKVAELRPFQRHVAEQAGNVTLVTAGCGSGKTLAAYHWAAERCPGRRLYMCYPTTGTATEGFRDYVFDEALLTSRVGARLFHGRQNVDEYLILGVSERDDSESDTLARIDSLRAWSTPVVTCTVDTVLGLMANQRRGLYAWPALSGAAFVFDEIHAYDDRLFGKLLRFIGDLKGLPVLLMTASLPESRLRDLRQIVKRHRECDLVQIAGPPELESVKRYHREHCAGDGDILKRVQTELSQTGNPGRVLWVCNTVNRAISFAEQCEASGLSPLVYHSRFRYGDRVRQHKAVIEQFRADTKPALAICTQVAEMSLDLSATLLVTDRAPIPALIQRLGRLNRRATDPSAPTMPFIVVEPVTSRGTPNSRPYSDDEFAESEEWLNSLPAAISQRDLVEYWQQLPERECREPYVRSSSWIDGGPRREVTPIREMDHGINVLMNADALAVQSRKGKLAELVLPMPTPRDPGWREWEDCFGVPIVPNGLINYDAQRGARWRRDEDEEVSDSP